MWSWTLLLCHRVEAGLQDRGFRDNGMSRNWIELFDTGWCFKCCINRATELLCPYKADDVQIVNRTYNCSCPFLDMIVSQGEVRTLRRDKTELRMTSSRITFPSLPQVSDLVVHCHVTRENVGLFPSLSKEYRVRNVYISKVDCVRTNFAFSFLWHLTIISGWGILRTSVKLIFFIAIL